MEAICPPTPVAQKQSPAGDLETLLLNCLPVVTVTEEDVVSPDPSTDSVEGCFSCGGLTHKTDQCRTLDESFPFLPTGWQAEHIGDKFILGTGSWWGPGPHQAPGTADGKLRLIRGEGWVARISDDYKPQLPVVGKDIPEPAVLCHVGTARLEETVNIRTRSVGCAVRRPYSDSAESDNDVWYAEVDDSALNQPTVDLCGEGCAQLDDFKWFLPTDERAADLSAPESEIETSDSESGVDFIEPISTHLQTETTNQQLLRPLVVDQTRPM